MSKSNKPMIIIVLSGAILAACASQPLATLSPVINQGDNPYAAQTGDGSMMQSKVEIVSASIVMTDSLPRQVSVSLAFRLTTPCNQLRVNISQPDSAKRIHLEVYGVALKDKPCTLMALATPQQANISLGSYSTGQYTVWINGVQMGEFKSQ
jgi:hypothetical protein